MSEYYVSSNGYAVYVKEAEFFKSQGGLTAEWGKHWKGPVAAESIHEARVKGARLFGRELDESQRRLSWLEENRPL